MEELINSAVKILFEAILVSGILGYIFLKREERLKRTIEEEFKKRDTFFSNRFQYKQRAVEELLGPVMMQLKRSSITLGAYSANNTYREGILKECNETIRELLLTKGYLLPPELHGATGDFLKHYDGWLQHYHQIREVEKDLEKPFVFTFDFPKDAEKQFRTIYDRYRNELKIDENLN